MLESKLQCGFGLLGLCCLDCLRGPCRIVPFQNEIQHGICGDSKDTMVVKNLLKRLAISTAMYTNYGQKLLDQLMKQHRFNLKVKTEKRDRIIQLALKDYLSGATALKLSLTKQRLRLLSKYKILPETSGYPLFTTPKGILHSNIYETTLQALAPMSIDMNELLVIGLRCALANLSTLHLISNLVQTIESKYLPQWCTLRETRNQKLGNQELLNRVAENMRNNKIYGIAIFVGCTELTQNERLIYDALTKSDIMAISLGCQDIEHSIGSCIEGATIASFLKSLSTELRIDGSLVPVMAIFCEQIDKRIEVMAYWMTALGMPVYWTKVPPIVGSQVAIEFFTKTVETWFGGYFIWDKEVAGLIKILCERAKNSGLKPM